ncbi:hypothetical protein [Thorsellia anophelis]|uniref:Uncharacterized protein n=1 Tax=Thorsellia anophelis DSM 18579 TaxID=1123402 RepID=A0A1I0D495_9GAMM|nr:hypothetical protein [Thorsellia anophelis]SET27043.1 hypothetical protein SAMN02583745_01841 [Thorsellia anophelis DSM 18579]
MSNAGFAGGCRLLAIGTIEEMESFFKALYAAVPDDCIYLIDDLYYRYIKFEDIKKFEPLIQSLKLKFDNRYENYINKLLIAIDISEHDYTKYQILAPTRVVNANIFKYTMLKEIPLEEIDKMTNNDIPYWKR